MLLIGIAASSSFQTNRDVHAGAGGERRGRRPHRHLRAADGRRRPNAHRLRRRARRRGGTASASRCIPSRRYFRPTGVGDGDDRQLLRRRGDQRGRAEGRRRQRLLDRGAAGHHRRCRRRVRAADEGFRACVSGAPGTPPQCRAVSRLMRAAAANPRLRPAALAQIDSLQAATARAAGAELPGRRRAGDLPRHRRPARHLDLDRRPDRPDRRADRALARPRRPPPAGGRHRVRGAEGSQVPRDPRRRARPRRRQALRRGLRPARRRAAQGGGRDPRPGGNGNGAAARSAERVAKR